MRNPVKSVSSPWPLQGLLIASITSITLACGTALAGSTADSSSSGTAPSDGSSGGTLTPAPVSETVTPTLPNSTPATDTPSGSPSTGGGGNANNNTDDVTQAYWYDGNIRRPIWIDPSAGTVLQVAPSAIKLFKKSADSSTRPIKGLNQGASPAALTTPRPPGSASGSNSSTLSASTKASGATSGGDAGTALTKALPGGVIVALKQALPDSQARAFLQTKGLTAISEIGAGSGLWLVQSAAGLASLNLANSLYESGAFLSAQPNWWQERTLK